MKEQEGRDRAFEMPLTSPEYPPGPYYFVNREYLIITYRTDRAKLQALVPEPLLRRAGFINGGYCHATFEIVNDRVIRLLSSGEQNQIGAPDAYCAPIIRTCLGHVDEIRSQCVTAAHEVGPPPR